MENETENTPGALMNWRAIKMFCFTNALPDGLWLRDEAGLLNWFSFDFIRSRLGQGWIDLQMRRVGWNAGSWIDAVISTPVNAGTGWPLPEGCSNE